MPLEKESSVPRDDGEVSSVLVLLFCFVYFYFFFSPECFFSRSFHAHFLSPLPHRYRRIVVKYIDPVSQRPYWHNPQSNVTVWTKPLLLVEGECEVRRTVELPFPDVEFANACANCSDRVISRWCDKCDEMFCETCADEIHHAGKKKVHDRYAFDVCVECEYQTASRRCNECTDTYCDTCYWRCHKKGNLKLHTWKPLLDLCQYCDDQSTAVAVRVYCAGAMQAQAATMLQEQADAGIDPNDPSTRQPPVDERMCNRCFNTIWAPQGYVSTPLEFTCHAIEREKSRMEREANEKYALVMAERRKEADERRRIIHIVSKIQAIFRRRKTGHVWGGKLKNLHVDLLIKMRMDVLSELKKTWWYKVRREAGKAPVLENDTVEELEEKLLPARLLPRDLRRLYPWMARDDVEKYGLRADRPKGVRKAIKNIKWTCSKKPIEKLKNGGKASVKILGITAESVFGDMFNEENRDAMAMWVAAKTAKQKRKVLTSIGKNWNKKFTKWAASMEMKSGSRNRLTKFFRRRARKMLLMSKHQHRLNRRDQIYHERWKELDGFRETELKKWKKAMDFEANKKYWYHKETGVTRYDDPAKEARKEADAEMLERKIRTKKRLLRMGRKRGEDEEEEEEESSDEEAAEVEELLREELGGSEESDYDSEDIPLGAETWKGKEGADGGDDDSSSGSGSSSEDEGEDGEEGEEGEEGETKDNGQYAAATEYEASGEQYAAEYAEEWGAESGYAAAGGYEAEGEQKEEWSQEWDDASQAYFWYNAATGESKWE